MSKRLLARLLLAGLLLPSAGLRAQEEDDWFGPDKALHYGVSMGLASAGYGSCGLVCDNVWLRLAGGACLSSTAGISKELIDLALGGPFSWRDMACNAAGMVTGLFVVWSIDQLPAVFGDEPPAAPEQREELEAPDPPPELPPEPPPPPVDEEVEIEPEPVPEPDPETSPQALAF